MQLIAARARYTRALPPGLAPITIDMILADIIIGSSKTDRQTVKFNALPNLTRMRYVDDVDESGLVANC